MIDLTEISNIINTANTVNRVKIQHHVRNSYVDKYLLQLNKDNIDDEYSRCCQNLLVNSPIEFLNYMFDYTVTTFFDNSKKTNLTQNCPNFYVKTTPGEGTIIFTSLRNEQQIDFVNKANEWALNTNKKIEFVAINSENVETINAEAFAEYYLFTHTDKHIVFIVGNMVSRSFSVSKLTNGIMMVNEPAYAAARQKMDRITTIDKSNSNKIGHMYWFNFNNIKVICPLYILIYQDYLDNKNKQTITGKSASLMLDSINVFEQCQNLQKEQQCPKWTVNSLFSKINNGILSHDSLKSYIINCQTNLMNSIKELLNVYNINQLALKNNKLGDTNEKPINAGKSKIINKNDNKKNNKTAEIKILTYETVLQLIKLTLDKEQSDRDLSSFLVDASYIFGAAIVEKAQTELIDIYDNFFNNNINKLPVNKLV